MTHYAHMITVNRLQMAVNLGFYNGERAKPQPVEVCFRLYFPSKPNCSIDDEAEFIDYGMLCKALQDFVLGREFRLIEFMAMELFGHLRAVITSLGGANIKLWLQLNKIAAPVPGLTGGACFTHSDLPPDATFVAS